MVDNFAPSTVAKYIVQGTIASTTALLPRIASTLLVSAKAIDFAGLNFFGSLLPRPPYT
jgi:hypothetical protein